MRAERGSRAAPSRADRSQADDRARGSAQGRIARPASNSFCAQTRSAWRRQRQRQPRSSASVDGDHVLGDRDGAVAAEFVITIGEATISGNSMAPTPAAGLWIQRSRGAAARCAGVIREPKRRRRRNRSQRSSSESARTNVCSGNSRRSRSTCASGMHQAELAVDGDEDVHFVFFTRRMSPITIALSTALTMS
jgi:hypothetical protein